MCVPFKMMSSGSHRRFSPVAIAIVFSVFCFTFFTFQKSTNHDVRSPGVPQSLDHVVTNAPFVDENSRLHAVIQKPEALPTPDSIPEKPPVPTQSSLPLPHEYASLSSSGSVWCNDRFETPYLTNLSRTQTEYCDSLSSTSSLRCFNSPTGASNRIDSFCVGGPSLFDVHEKKFKLDCKLREFDEKEKQKSPPLNQFPTYWYQTGPHILMNQYMDTDAPAEHVSELAKFPRKFTILVRREDVKPNLWHELMQISSMVWTLDVLRMTRDVATGNPLFTLEDVENTRVLILDDLDEGPFYGMWTMFAKRPITRLSKVSEIDFRDSENIIIPLPGGSNPMWQGDWKPHSCDHSSLLNVFSNRVLDFYGVDRMTKRDDSQLVLTFIDRREKRRLIGKEDFVEELKKTYPDVKVQMVNFAAIPFSEQLKVIRDTDVLVGVHGAGLTHGLFLAPGSAMVEILPADFHHKGFRNLAQLLGHRYFSSHAVSNGTKGDWQLDDFSFDKSRFMQLVNVAITSMYNRGLRNDDVI